MKPWPRKKKEEPAPGSPGTGFEIPLDLDSLDLDKLALMSNNVMRCRDNLNAMLEHVEEHRSDGHECPAFCVPRAVSEYLNRLPREVVIMLLVVLMKDLDVAYVPQEPAS